ncbi:MAG: hypothetical protein K6T83_12135 [Alicyclobacillus sp.]|nr:hypothetical protein [Alicyclobacillus sp.]
MSRSVIRPGDELGSVGIAVGAKIAAIGGAFATALPSGDAIAAEIAAIGGGYAPDPLALR